MQKARFNVVLPTRSFAGTRQFATRAEARGYDAVAVEDHYVMRGPMRQPEDPRLECFTALTAVAMMTNRVKLAPLDALASPRMLRDDEERGRL
jgi:alkanesulfonate monooxygenase SsuD/methylene tetrahydromethanopterin reductase-like flavin-dependent oxidoreductase (luciferase family)